MRNFIYTGIALGLLVLSMTSCGVDFEKSDNGALDGYWHLEQIDSLKSGGIADCSQQRIFWGIEAKLLNVKDVDKDGGRGYLFRFKQTADSLVLYSPYKFNWHEDGTDAGGDHPVEDVAPLTHYGINGLEEHFVKEALDSKKMILRSKTLRLRFRKF